MQPGILPVRQPDGQSQPFLVAPRTGAIAGPSQPPRPEPRVSLLPPGAPDPHPSWPPPRRPGPSSKAPSGVVRESQFSASTDNTIGRDPGGAIGDLSSQAMPGRESKCHTSAMHLYWPLGDIPPRSRQKRNLLCLGTNKKGPPACSGRARKASQRRSRSPVGRLSECALRVLQDWGELAGFQRPAPDTTLECRHILERPTGVFLWIEDPDRTAQSILDELDGLYQI